MKIWFQSRNFFSLKALSVFTFTFLFSSMGFAAEPLSLMSVGASFSAIELSLTLVLGFSICAVLLTRLLAVESHFKWHYVLAPTLAFIAILFAGTHFSALLPIILPISFSAFLLLFSLWFLEFSEVSDVNKTDNYSLLGITAFSGGIAMLMLPSVFVWLAWLTMSFVALFVTGHHIYKHVNQQLKPRAASQWLIMLLFLVSVLLHLKQFAAIDVVILVGALTFLSALINHTWLAIKGLRVYDVTGVLPKRSTSNEPVQSANLDSSTNLPTSPQALRQLDQLIINNPDKRYAVLTFKPLNFEQVNSVLGHHNSDILLLQLAYCLQQKLESNEALHNFNESLPACRIARLQGLHFVVVLDLSLTEHPDNSVIDQLRKQLTLAVPKAMTFKSYSLNFDLVFGAALVGQHGYSAAEVISHAVDALLIAEQQQIPLSYYDNKQTLYTEKQLLQMEKLKQAIQEGHLHYFLQPQVVKSEQRFIGLTLKAHWYANKDKPLLLEDFLDVAEQSGEIFMLFRQMVNVALEGHSVLSALNVNQPIAIPVVSEALLEPDIIEYLEQKLKKKDINPDNIFIDIDESILLSAPKKASAFIHQLTHAGVQVAISQFTGSFEALRYLRKLSISRVKIGCAGLVDNDEKNAEKVITNALLSLCKTMNLTLVGTEINTPPTERIFSSIGGAIMQGNAVDHGVVIDELEVWVKKWGYNQPSPQSEQE